MHSRPHSRNLSHVLEVYCEEAHLFDSNWQRLDFGTDEFVQFCRNADMEPQITVNFGVGTPDEAADWVEYANGDRSTFYGTIRAEDGHPEPR